MYLTSDNVAKEGDASPLDEQSQSSTKDQAQMLQTAAYDTKDQDQFDQLKQPKDAAASPEPAQVALIQSTEPILVIEANVEEKEMEEKTPDDVQTEQKEEEKVDPWVSFEQSFLEEEVEEEKKTNDDTVVEENVKVVTMSKRVLDVLVSVRASEKLTVAKLCEEASELRQYTIKDWTDTLKFLVMEEGESS